MQLLTIVEAWTHGWSRGLYFRFVESCDILEPLQLLILSRVTNLLFGQGKQIGPVWTVFMGIVINNYVTQQPNSILPQSFIWCSGPHSKLIIQYLFNVWNTFAFFLQRLNIIPTLQRHFFPTGGTAIQQAYGNT